MSCFYLKAIILQKKAIFFCHCPNQYNHLFVFIHFMWVCSTNSINVALQEENLCELQKRLNKSASSCEQCHG